MLDSQSLDLLETLNAENEQNMAMDEEEDCGTEAEEASLSETQGATQTVFESNKRLKAGVWKEFISVELGSDGKRRGRCIHCNKKMIVETSQGTSAVKRHLESCPKRPKGMSQTSRVYDPKVDRAMVTELIIYHDLPFRYVEYEMVRARDKYLNPECQHICRQIAASDVFKRYEKEKQTLKKTFADFKGRVCLTSDLWTAKHSMMGYICVTAHYVDAEWRLNNKILAFCEFKPPHSGEELASKVISCLKEWGLEKKVFSLTLDNASSNDSMQRILKHRLQMISGNGLLCDGKFFHVRCSAHILDLIVKEGLELATDLLENIRDSVKFVKASPGRKESFAACVASVGVEGAAGLSLDVSTRWNSTYDMLARALKFRKAFASLKECDRSYRSLPSENEWNRGEKLCGLLKPFSIITTYFSGVKYPTASIYFIQVWRIEILLRKYASCGDSEVENIAKRMQSKFTKYWDEYSITLAMGAVLDPRLKLQMVKAAYHQLDPITCEEKLESVKKNLKLLYEEYKTKSWVYSSNTSTTPTPNDLLTESPLEDDLNYDLFALERTIEPILERTRSNLDLYLEEDRVELNAFSEIDVLDYWKNIGQKYGDLALLACDLLSVPITTVASESAFSVGGRVLSLFRNRLLPKNVQALLCTRNWLRGFAEFEGNVEELFDDESEDITKKTCSVRV